LFSKHFTGIIQGWEGYRVKWAQRFEAEETSQAAEVWIELVPKRKRRLVCSGCGRKGHHVHETVERWIRDLPILGASTHLLVHRRRVNCRKCGPKLEELPWIGRYERVTRRLAESVVRMCAILPIKHVANYFDLDRKTVKAIDKKHLQATLPPIDALGVEAIVVDEFAIRKGHRYATVVADALTGRVLWVGNGCRREDIRPFFLLLGKEGCAKLKAVAMDMYAAYELEVHAYCPTAQIVYDLFHVVAKYGREVIDRVRVDEINRLHQDKNARQVIQGSRWLLLRNRDNIREPKDQVRLQELLKANKALSTVYVLKDDLKQLWDFRQDQEAMAFWKQWYNRAVRSRIKPLILFAKRLKVYLHGILAHCVWPLHTSIIEGINNKIKLIKRMAYGYRDNEYFFLKIRAAFPGKWT
jgi:transposase